MTVFKNASGEFRAGWVIAAFAVVCVLAEGAVLWAFFEARLISLALPTRLDSPWVIFQTLPTLIAGGLATLVCWAAFRVPTGLRDAQWLSKLGLGLVLGFAALSVCVLAPVLVGATSLRPGGLGLSGALGMGLLQLVTLAPAGIGEEVMMRGLAFQALRRRAGDLVAVLVSGSLFGVLHLNNPESSWLASLIIALVGIWFALLAVRTGSLWMSVGVHVAWNWAEGFFFGQPVSGNAPGRSLFSAGVAEPGFWSGGAFGPEAAGWTAVVLIATIALTAARRA